MPRRDRPTTRYEIDPEASEVWIDGSSSVHPIRAHACGLTGWIEMDDAGALEAVLAIEVERLQSGNPLVDRETRRRIDAGTYPTITGTVTESTPDGTGGHVVTGEIAFRGEVRTVTGNVTTVVDDGQLTVEGEQTLDVRDWGLRLPRLGLLRVHPDVGVRIKVIAHADA